MNGAMIHSRIQLIVLVSLLALIWVNLAQGTPGDDYLDDKESQVTRLQAQVEMNHRRQCELLASCDKPANCSRMSCWPLVDDVKRTTCQEVQNNSYCPATSAAACPSKKFDFTKPYVRLAPTTDKAAAETATTICSQRELSTVFKDICNPESLSRAFFGAVDGTYMHFPGSDQSAQDCGIYDPRSRTWFRTSTSVAKAVMVLLDVGVSMGNAVPAPLQGTFFTTARAIVLELLNTLSEQDFVNIITFDSTKATSLASSPVRVLLNDTGNSSYHPEFNGLITNLANLNLENLQRPSNISLGIAEALRNYAPGYPSSMKIIVAFTDGNAANLKDGALAALQNQNGTKIFIFKLPQPDDVANRFLRGSPFLTQLSNMGGSFNVITSEASNMLYSIEPYFGFLASFRASINSSADYSIIYEDFEHVVDNIFSISKPAFDDDGKLLGVVGLNIFVDELGNLTDLVKEALQPRTLSKTFDPTKIVLTAANASIQVADNPALPCPNITTPPNAGLCAATDTESTIEKLACCNACSATKHAHSTYKNIAIAASVGGVVIAAAVFVIFWFWKHRCGVRPTEEDQFSGDDEDIYPGPGGNGGDDDTSKETHEIERVLD